jgi:hypothetical protein
MNAIRKHRAKALPCSTPNPSAKANGNNSTSAGGALQRQWPVTGKGNLSRTPGSKNINIFKKYSVTYRLLQLTEISSKLSYRLFQPTETSAPLTYRLHQLTGTSALLTYRLL